MKITKEDLKKYDAYHKGDTAYASYARLLQSKWRSQKGYPMQNYGNFLELEFSLRTKANFLTDAAKQLASMKVEEAKKTKSLISEPRIWNNLLSSQPLCFNLFSDLSYDLPKASALFSMLYPGLVDTVTKIDFEYSPGRGNPKYSNDHSAFDVFVEYLRNGKKGFIGIEVKYSESLKEETKEKAEQYFKERYIEISNNSGLFKSNALEILRNPPLSQIWRDHLLSIVTKQDYDQGFFVYLFPSENIECFNGVNLYQQQLLSSNKELNGFYVTYLENVINALKKVFSSEWVNELE